MTWIGPALGGGQGDRSYPGGKVADPVTEVVGERLDSTDNHDAVVAVFRLRVVDVIAGPAEGVGEQPAAGAVLGLGEHEDVLATCGQPVQLAFSTLRGGVGDVETQQTQL